jgi:transcriptional regulator with XRE-family HTH domain
MRPSKDPQMALGAAAHELREERGLSKSAVAAKSGLSLDVYSAFEAGHANPLWGTVRRVAKALDVAVAELAEREERPSMPLDNDLSKRNRDCRAGKDSSGTFDKEDA